MRIFLSLFIVIHNVPGFAASLRIDRAKAKSGPAVSSYATGVYSILDFGAVADGKTINSRAIQATIDACTRAGGGRVCVPPGVFLTGTIQLRDNVLLYLEHGAVLKGSLDFTDYQADPSAAHKNLWGPDSEGYVLIAAENARNFGIVGSGVIDGQGTRFMRHASDPNFVRSRQKHDWFPAIVYFHQRKENGGMQIIWLTCFIDCKNVTVRDVTLRDSEFWSMALVNCSDVCVQGVKVWSYLHVRNTDGIDLMGCRNVDISDCDFRCGEERRSIKLTGPHGGR